MESDNIQARIAMMKAVVDPWYQALANPAKAQEIVLERLLGNSKQTEYGRLNGCDRVGSYADYQNAFPVQTFNGFKPFIDQVLAGDTHALLSEEPIYVGLTKGTTGEPKIFPFTADHLKVLRELNLRVIFNYSLSSHNFGWMSGYRLNLVPSAKVGTIKVGEKELLYGYSSAVVASIIEKKQ